MLLIIDTISLCKLHRLPLKSHHEPHPQAQTNSLSSTFQNSPQSSSPHDKSPEAPSADYHDTLHQSALLKNAHPPPLVSDHLQNWTSVLLIYRVLTCHNRYGSLLWLFLAIEGFWRRLRSGCGVFVSLVIVGSGTGCRRVVLLVGSWVLLRQHRRCFESVGNHVTLCCLSVGTSTRKRCGLCSNIWRSYTRRVLTMVSNQPILVMVPLVPSENFTWSPSKIFSERCRDKPAIVWLAISLLARPNTSVPVAPTLKRDCLFHVNRDRHTCLEKKSSANNIQHK